jgi:ribonuclease E
LGIAFIKLDKWKQNGFMLMKDEIFFNLKENISLGEEVIIQISKEQISKKGPTLTQEIVIQDGAIKGYPYKKDVNYLDKNFNISDKKYLRTITTLVKPKHFGLNVKKTENKVNIWNIISNLNGIEKDLFSVRLKLRNNKTCPNLISAKQKITDIILGKTINQKETTIVVPSELEALKIRNELTSKRRKKNKICLEYCSKKIAGKYEFYIDSIVQNALESNVTLDTGGYIVIEKTEALTSIDVNSGSFNKLRSSRESILWINLAASKEIISQLRLKNISGIIVIDFIDMINQNDQLSLLEYLNTQLQSNLSGSQIIQISEIGLVEITKQREGRNIYDIFTIQCFECQGRGYIKNTKLSNKSSIYFSEISSIYG